MESTPSPTGAGTVTGSPSADWGTLAAARTANHGDLSIPAGVHLYGGPTMKAFSSETDRTSTTWPRGTIAPVTRLAVLLALGVLLAGTAMPFAQERPPVKDGKRDAFT